jgi:hypothetical protein
MSTARVHLITTEENKNLPILIIDKKGVIGEALAKVLREQFLVVLVSENEPEFHQNVIHIPYRRKIPVIPDNTYSHIFVFYNGENETLAILPSVMKRANAAGGKTLFLTSLSHSGNDLYKRLSQHLYHSMPIVLYGEVFDDHLQIPNLVNYFIYQAKNFGKVEIPNEGMGKLLPVYLEDLLAVIIAIAFSHESRKGYYFAFPRTPFSEMTLARVFQRINSEIKIDFTKKKIKTPIYQLPPEGEYIFQKYNLEGGLRKALSEKAFGDIDNRPVRPLAIRAVRKDLNFRKLFLWLALAVLVPFFLILSSAGLGSAFLSVSVSQATDGKFERALSFSEAAESAFGFSKNISEGYIPLDLVSSSVKNSLIKKLNSGERASRIGGDILLSLSTFNSIYKEENSEKNAEVFIESLADTKNSLLELEQMRAEGDLPKSVLEKLNEGSYLLALFENGIDTLPDILGFEGERRYLLLFQNNMELRPGGGFIGSYGLVSVKRGRFGKIEIHDVYDADGKLKTHVEPPFGLRRFGGVSHWFLRDSNFGIEGTTNAAAAADLLRRSTGDKVDGVLMVDTEFVKNILDVTGPVEVLDYKETVDSSNFYLLTQKHAEENFFPGSTQKKDFLRSLLNSLLVRFSGEQFYSYGSAVKMLEKSIKEKHLLFVPLDQKIQKIFVVNNLTGDILDSREREDSAFFDFLATVDANIGANKGNYYVKRSVEYTASISDSGQLFGETSITFENTSTEKSIFGGNYKNYLSFVLPEGSDLRAVLIDGRQVDVVDAVTSPAVYTSADFVPPAGIEVERSRAEDKEVFSFLIEVPVQRTKRVTVNYAIPQAINTDISSFVYSLRLFKQPGTVDDQYKLTLKYPSGFVPVDLGEGIVDLGGKLVAETRLTEDFNINVKLSQK